MLANVFQLFNSCSDNFHSRFDSLDTTFLNPIGIRLLFSETRLLGIEDC